MEPEWNELQTEIGQCELCRTHFPRIAVNCPPGSILPDDAPLPGKVNVLFVGVAPSEKGRHFYTDPNDKLKRGLFSILKELGYLCSGADAFLKHDFLLLHTEKCAIQGTTSPSLPVSQFCASHHLKREIEHLLPAAVCWLSSNIGYPVCYSLVREWGKTAMPFGEVTSVSIKGHNVYFMATKWPGRGWEQETKTHLKKLFEKLDGKA